MKHYHENCYSSCKMPNLLSQSRALLLFPNHQLISKEYCLTTMKAELQGEGDIITTSVAARQCGCSSLSCTYLHGAGSELISPPEWLGGLSTPRRVVTLFLRPSVCPSVTPSSVSALTAIFFSIVALAAGSGLARASPLLYPSHPPPLPLHGLFQL